MRTEDEDEEEEEEILRASLLSFCDNQREREMEGARENYSFHILFSYFKN